MALTEQGYHRPTYDEILEAKIQTAKELFGEDIETSEQTPFGKFVRIGAYDLAKAYEDLEAIYYARFPNTATGVSLDRLCVFAGISRNAATQAQHVIKVYSSEATDEATEIGIGELVVSANGSDITFYNVNNFTLPFGGDSIEVIVECAEAGLVGNLSGIDEIVNPIAEVERVEYVRVEEAGEEAESDYELRKRFSVAIEGVGGSNANAIRAALLRIPTVTSASVIENRTDETVDGRPPRSFECFVYGGEGYEQDIAQAIFDKAPMGIKSCSTTTPFPDWLPVQVLDDGGFPHDVYFSFTKNVVVDIVIHYIKDATFETDGKTQLRNVLTDHINGLGVGADVVKSALYGYICGISGVVDVSGIDLSAEGKSLTGNGNVPIEQWEVARVGNITLIEVTD